MNVKANLNYSTTLCLNSPLLIGQCGLVVVCILTPRINPKITGFPIPLRVFFSGRLTKAFIFIFLRYNDQLLLIN
jgi:hypothetical protein